MIDSFGAGALGRETHRPASQFHRVRFPASSPLPLAAVGGSGLFSARDEAALVLCVPVVVLNGTAATIQSSPRPSPGWEAGAGEGTRRR